MAFTMGAARTWKGLKRGHHVCLGVRGRYLSKSEVHLIRFLETRESFALIYDGAE